MHTALWTCLDKRGHDACRIVKIADGWCIEGTAVNSDQGVTASLSYRLICDQHWFSRSARVSGWVGAKDIELTISDEPGIGWLVNGVLDVSLGGLLDIDLGFTPASNTSALRRLNLRTAQSALCEAVWLDTEDWQVKRLSQQYTRIGPHAYDYFSPLHGYRATLTVTDDALVSEYPGLWSLIDTADAK